MEANMKSIKAAQEKFGELIQSEFERIERMKADQEVTATAMIHKLKGYSTKGQSYNNYLFAMYQDNQRLIAAHM